MGDASIIVGMSGGVDSSVAALLLQGSGEAIAGMFMQNWEEDGRGGPCRADVDRKDHSAPANDRLREPYPFTAAPMELWMK